MKSLFVSEISIDGLRGFTESPKHIYHNLSLINPSLLNSLNDSLGEENEQTYTANAGRFIAFITVSLDKGVFWMMLIDLQKDESKARQLEQKIGTGIMMKAFYDNLSTYDLSYFYFSLELGMPPQD